VLFAGAFYWHIFAAGRLVPGHEGNPPNVTYIPLCRVESLDIKRETANGLDLFSVFDEKFTNWIIGRRARSVVTKPVSRTVPTNDSNG
jgi:hypothetical protein